MARFCDNLNERGRQIMEGRKEGREAGGWASSRGFVLGWPGGPWLHHCGQGRRKKSKLQRQDDEVSTGSSGTEPHGGHLGSDGR